MVVTFVLPHRIFGPGALSTDAARVRNSCDVFRFNVSHKYELSSASDWSIFSSLEKK